MYLASRKKVFVKHLGGDVEFLEKLGKYFGCMMMEARRIPEPLAGDGRESESEDSGADVRQLKSSATAYWRERG